MCSPNETLSKLRKQYDTTLKKGWEIDMIKKIAKAFDVLVDDLLKK